MSVPEKLDQFQTLVDIFVRLRAPDGCPWDKEQSHVSLRENLLEECYEVLAALDEGDADKLCDELGDLLMQIVFHAMIASEAGQFDIEEVVRGINNKLIYRHPHIFGSATVRDAKEVEHNWQALKREERGDSSILASIPEQMPALGYSQTAQYRVAQVGFDWEDISGVIDKLAEEVTEFKESSGEETIKEFGDLLFSLVNYARRLGIDSESALRGANKRFYRRFSYMEEVCRRKGVSIGDLPFAEQNSLWEEAKEETAEL